MSISAKRRETEVFSLAFLDCICCGFGAVILVFILTLSQKTSVDKADMEDAQNRLQKMQRDTANTQEDLDRLARVLAAAQLELDDANAKNTQDQLRLTNRERELLLMVSFLVFAGFDTTRNQLGLMMQTFAAHQDQWALVRERPDRARAAVEEVMRVNPTITWFSREANADFTYKDLDIRAGDVVHIYNIPVGADPRKYNPIEFDIAAQRAPHFGFGGGIHHCLGHYVARVDMREALSVLNQRIPSFRILPAATYLPDSGNTGPTNLPIAFS